MEARCNIASENMHDYVEDGLKPCITFPCASLCAVVLGRDKSWRSLLNEYGLNRCEDIVRKVYL